MGYLDIKPATTSAKFVGNSGNVPNGSVPSGSLLSGEMTSAKIPSTGNLTGDPSSSKDQISRAKFSDGSTDRSENLAPPKIKGVLSSIGPDAPLVNLPPGIPKPPVTVKFTDDSAKLSSEELTAKAAPKTAVESEVHY